MELRQLVEMSLAGFDISGLLESTARVSRKQKKICQIMREFKKGELHSGSKKGPIVTDRRQAIAIALSQAGKRS